MQQRMLINRRVEQARAGQGRAGQGRAGQGRAGYMPNLWQLIVFSLLHGLDPKHSYR